MPWPARQWHRAPSQLNNRLQLAVGPPPPRPPGIAAACAATCRAPHAQDVSSHPHTHPFDPSAPRNPLPAAFHGRAPRLLRPDTLVTDDARTATATPAAGLSGSSPLPLPPSPSSPFRVAPRARSHCPSPPILVVCPVSAAARVVAGTSVPRRAGGFEFAEWALFSGPGVWCRRRWIRAGFSAPDAYPDPPPATHPVAWAHRVVSFGRLIRRFGSAFVRRSALSDAS